MIRPSPIENGTLQRLTIAKNHAAVPRNSFTGKRAARKYIDITGPRRVGDHRREAAERAVGRRGDAVRPAVGDVARPSGARQQRDRDQPRSRITPIVRFTHASSANARKATPSSDPDDHRGGEPQQRLPVRVPAVVEDREQVGDDQQQQERAGRLLRRQHRREDRHGDGARAGDARSWRARRQRRRGRAAPRRTQVRSGTSRQRRPAASAASAMSRRGRGIPSSTAARRPAGCREPRPRRPDAASSSAMQPGIQQPAGRARAVVRGDARTAEVSTPIAVRQTSAMPRTTRPPMIGETPTTRAGRGPQRLADARHGEDRTDRDDRVRRRDQHDVGVGDRLEHAGRGRAPRRCPGCRSAPARAARGAASTTPGSASRARDAVARRPRDRHDRVDLVRRSSAAGVRRAASAATCRASTSRGREALAQPAGAREMGAEVEIAEREPRPARAPRLQLVVDALGVAGAAPAALGVVHSGQRVERSSRHRAAGARPTATGRRRC